MQKIRRIFRKLSVEGDRFVFWVVLVGGMFALIR